MRMIEPIYSKIRLKKTAIQLLFWSVIFVACSSPQLPQTYSEVNEQPKIYPDYKEVVIPCNICPLSFIVENDADEYVTSISFGEDIYLKSGKNVSFSSKEWKQLLENAAGSKLTVSVYVRDNIEWKKFAPFTIRVAEEPIDAYLSYRIISPSYVAYEDLTIRQRDLTSFEETEIYNNMLISTEQDGQCINCHSYQNYSTDNMQFHARQAHGGTMLVVDGEPRKINLKTDSTLSAGVYPAWHPTKKLIVYSTNETGQSFHTKHRNKVEVQDTYSDLILYDITENTVCKVEAEADELETYPAWSPDGKMLYYVAAHFVCDDSMDVETQFTRNYRQVRYDLYRKPFDIETKTFGPKELLYSASEENRSATLPRISPDGRFLLLTIGDYGCFHIWHKSSDLFLMDLQSDSLNLCKLENLNSPDVESYHSWSGNGRWIVFSSRREDGNHTRPYIAYFDKDGVAHKPFILPQKNPEYYREFCKSYNIPEFMKEPVKITPHTFANEFKKPAIQAKYRNK